MIVEDLMSLLSEYPSDMKVAITAIGGGFNDVTFVDNMTLVTDYNSEKSGRGLHEDQDYVEIINPDSLSVYLNEEYIIIK